MSDAVCWPRRIVKRDQLDEVRALRKLAAFRFVTPTSVVERPIGNLELPDIFRAVFGLELDERVTTSLSDLFATEMKTILRRKQRDSRGYIYCFRDLADPLDIVKIGRTVQRPEQRLAEWERTLSPQSINKGFLVLEFAYATEFTIFAETVVHQALRCWHIEGRVNPFTGSELVEFYRNTNILALSVFVRQTLAHVDAFCIAAREYQSQKTASKQRAYAAAATGFYY